MRKNAGRGAELLGGEAVGWGIAGTGAISRTMALEAKNMEGVSLTAVSSRTYERARVFADDHDIAHAHSGLAAMLAEPEVEAIYIALPHAAHRDAILECLGAGKHVLCEKPMAWTAADAALIAAHPRARELVVAEGFMFRVQPQWRFIIEALSTGRVGTVEAVLGFSAVQLPAPPQDSARCSLPWDRSALLDFGSYSVHMARAAFGGEPNRVTARMWKDGSRDSAVSIRLEFDSGHADLTATTRLRPARRFDILGSNGSLSVLTPIHIPPSAKAKVHAVLEGGPDAGETIEFDRVPQYGLQLAAVSRAIRTGERPPVGLENALGNARALDAVIRSAEADGAWAEVMHG